MSSASRSRTWCFTVNNPTEEGQVLLDRIVARYAPHYVVFQKETGENGTPHFQGYVRFSNAVLFKTLTKFFDGKAHLEPAKGSDEQQEHYCTKPHEGCECEHCKDCPPRLEGPWTHGKKQVGQGHRSDLDALVRTLSDSGLKGVTEEMPTMLVKYPSGVLTLNERFVQKRAREADISVYLVTLVLGSPSGDSGGRRPRQW